MLCSVKEFKKGLSSSSSSFPFFSRIQSLQTPPQNPATNSQRSQQAEGVSSSSQEIPSENTQENLAEHLDMQETASEEITSSDPLTARDRAFVENARKRNLELAQQSAGRLPNIRKKSKSARSR